MLLKDPASAESLQRLADILHTAWEVDADQATVADQIEAEVRELRGFAQSLRIANIDWKWWIIFLRPSFRLSPRSVSSVPSRSECPMSRSSE